MNQILSYQSKSFQDKFTLFHNDQQVGNLYKAEWLGNPIHGSLYGHHYKFVAKGFFRLKILVHDEDQQKEIGKIRLHKLGFHFTNGTMELWDRSEYKFKVSGFFFPRWCWLKEGKAIMSSEVIPSFFKSSGTIRAEENSQQLNTLLAAAGIHLKNRSKGVNLVSIVACSLFILSWLLTKM